MRRLTSDSGRVTHGREAAAKRNADGGIILSKTIKDKQALARQMLL